MSDTQLVAGMARAAMLVDLNISVYSGRKQDRTTQKEVTDSKGAKSKRAASVYKSLFAECAELEDIVKFQARVRQTHYQYTLPWADNGQRLLPTKALFDYQDAMRKYDEEFHRLVEVFLDKYDTLVAAAAFQLGTLFDRSEYPTRAQVARKFDMSVVYTPLPNSGDFRLDVESAVQNDLRVQYERRMQESIARANQDAWSRLHAVLTRISDRLTVDSNGKKRVFFDTTVTNAEELCGLLKALNVANDPALERARAKLESALIGITPQALREEDDTRAVTKQRVDEILSAYDWGITPDEDA